MELSAEDRNLTTRRVWPWVALAAIVVLLIALALWKSARSSTTMSAAASDDQQFAQTTPDSVTKLVLQIEDASAEGTFRGNLLRKKTEEIYLRTATTLTVHFVPKTSIVMGKHADLHSGAIVHVTGTVLKDRSIDATQLVILTGYVQVQ